MWTISAGAASAAAPTRHLTTARSRRFTFRLDGPRTLDFSIDARQDEANALTPLETDIWAWRDSDLLFRGRWTTAQGTLSPDVHTVQVGCTDYRGLLAVMNRTVGASGAVYSATDQAAIAWDLINDSQALTGGALGITNGSGSTTGVNRDRTIEPLSPIAEEIGLIGRLENGFDWEISPELELNRWHPQRGSVTNVVLDWRGVVSAAVWQPDPSKFGNWVAATGAEGLTVATASSAGLGTDPRGRYERVESHPSIINQSVLNARAPALLAAAEVLAVDWQVTLTPGTWQGAGHIWLGDTVTLAVKDGMWNFADPFRVVEIQVSVGESGDEVVQLSLVAA